MNETVTIASGHVEEPILKSSPKIKFGIVKEIPEGMANDIQLAVVDFIASSHVPGGVDLKGFYNQSLKAIANASILGGAGNLWLGTLDDKLVTYILANITDDIDGRLVYCVYQAWVRKDQRGQPWVKWAWEKVRQHAKDCFCHHFCVISSRGHTAAYCRFLGKGFRKYAEILKEEI